jgi:hypothetical protein
MDDFVGMQKLQSFQKLLREVPDAGNWKRLVLVSFQEVIQGWPK